MSASSVNVSPVGIARPVASALVRMNSTPVTWPADPSRRCGVAQWRMRTPLVCAQSCSSPVADISDAPRR